VNSLDFSAMQNDVATTVREAISSDRIVNVSVIAEKLRRRHEHLNIALEDIEALVLQCAEQCQSPMEFDGTANGAPLPDGTRMPHRRTTC
jgi:hypothetical protein